MSYLAIAAPFGFVLMALWALLPVRRRLKTKQSSKDLKIETFLPRHCRYFPQVRQALSTIDEEYLSNKAPRGAARIARRERRAVARQFLDGIHEDFTNLERLGRMVAVLSPVISGKQETERVVLGVKFRLLYVWVSLRLATGRAPLGQLEQLTGMVGSLATRMADAMAAVSALSAPELDSSL